MVRKEEIKKLTTELDRLRSDSANKSGKIKEL